MKPDMSVWSMTPPSEAPEFKQESTGWDLAATPETPEFSFNAFQHPMTGMPTPVTGPMDAITPTTGTINSPSEPLDFPPETTAFSIQDIFPDMKATDGLLFNELDFPDFNNNPNLFADPFSGYGDFAMPAQPLSYGEVQVQQPQFEDDSAGFLLDVYNDMHTYGINPGPGGL
jgi:hypothetical protein